MKQSASKVKKADPVTGYPFTVTMLPASAPLPEFAARELKLAKELLKKHPFPARFDKR